MPLNQDALRVAFLSPGATLGGAERVLLDILASLRSRRPGWIAHLVCGEEGPLLERAREAGAFAHCLPFPAFLAGYGDAGGGTRLLGRLALGARLFARAPQAAAYASRLKRLLAEIGPDLVHSNGLKMHLLGLWSKPEAAPMLWHIHDFVGRRPIASLLLRTHAGGVAAAIANSASVAADFERTCGGGLKARVVRNAVDTAEFSPYGTKLDLDAASGLPPAPSGTVRAGLVATMAFWKGHETFLRALARIPASAGLRGYVIGGTIYRTPGSQVAPESLAATARSLGLDGRVGFTGFVARAADAMRGLDIVVHASTEPEPFGLVIIEAMACGRAVIVSMAGGAAELASDGENALGHPPGDDQALAACLARLVSDAGLRARLGEAGRRTAERRFGRERFADELIPALETAARPAP